MVHRLVLGAAIFATCFFIVTLFFILLTHFCKARRKRADRTRVQTRASSSPVDLSSVTTYDCATFDPTLHQISMSDILHATKNFSPDLIIGDGRFGFVYKAKLSNGLTVAIKKLDKAAFQGFREFRAEMETLGKLRHPNIVKILGYCVSDMDWILIYELIVKGSLDQWLHDTFNSTSRLPLSWERRIKVIAGVANGLAYLHGLDKPIVHRDITSSNILLDSDFEAHIADFGLARRIDTPRSHVSTQVAGSRGYMPPEYLGGNTAATVLLDVYSFGILMIEVVTQRRPYLPVTMDDGDELGLMHWVKRMVEENREMEMIDGSVAREELDYGKVKEYFRVACMCSNENSRERPAMRTVVELLDPLIA